MNEASIYNLLTFLVTISTSGIVGFYFKRKIIKKNSIAIENHKGEVLKVINTELESHKGNIQNNLEKAKDLYIKENLESSRFVEVICKQRIEWLEKLRLDLAYIVATSRMLIGLREQKQNFELVGMANIVSQTFTDKSIPNENMDVIVQKWLDKVDSLLLQKSELLKTITILKLRLNSTEDYCLINLLDNLVAQLEGEIDKKQINTSLAKIVFESQKILSSEWKRTKREVATGKDDSEVDSSTELEKVTLINNN